MRNPEYIRFVLSKVENNIGAFSESAEYVKVITILHSLRTSSDILREIYILSGINKLRELSGYLAFMYKKTQAGRINLDNFLENYMTDREFIENYLQTYYNLEPSSRYEPREEESETKLFIEQAGEDEETLYSLAEPGFRVEEIDNELVSEEFKDTAILEEYNLTESRYLELIQNDGSGQGSDITRAEDEDVFSLPSTTGQKEEEEKTDEPALQKDLFADAPEDVREPESYTSIPKDEDFAPEPKKAESHDFESFFEPVPENDEADFSETEKPEKKEAGVKEKINPAEEKISEPGISEKEIIGARGPEDDSGISFGEIAGREKTLTGEQIFGNETDEEILPEEEKPIEKTEPTVEFDETVDKALKEIEEETSAEIINSEFTKYETELFEKNKTISGLFDDLMEIIESKEPDEEMKLAILEEIVKISGGLRDYSAQMSFEIITKVYSSFVFCFDTKFKDISVTKENIELFRRCTEGVEKLVRGEELKGFDTRIKMLDELEKDLNDLLSKREEFEKRRFDFGEEERKIIEEFSDSSEREAYLALRDRITDTEGIFNSITEAKDRVAPFEVLRRLSSSFAQFREIVNIARILEMHKMAQLSEAAYVFVKFLQNYRMDPYQKEVTEVLKYIVYCFKLIYLDKPVKELDTFISYLNDPVKIFHSNPKQKDE